MEQREGADEGAQADSGNAPVLRRRTVVAMGAAALFLWVFLFSAGVLVDSRPFRRRLAQADSTSVLASGVSGSPRLGERSGWFVMASVSYTPTNVAMLSILAGFLGGCASLLLYGYRKGPLGPIAAAETASIEEERLEFLTEHPVSSALRGFGAFLVFLAGTLVGSSQAFEATSLDQYCRMAGAVAVLAFAVGYDPTFFRQLITAIPRKK